MKRIILYILLFIVASHAFANEDVVVVDSAEWHTTAEVRSTKTNKPGKSLVLHNDSMPLTQKEIDRLFWKPDPIRAVWLGTIVPGLGQIYNRSYWKLPIVYGGFMGCIYAITYNNTQYEGYKKAYRDIYFDIQNNTVSNDPGKSYIDILPEGYTIDRMGGVSTYHDRLKDWQNRQRRYRDLSIAATCIVYALTIIDAYVDAQLFDFDISTDLSLNVYPELYYNIQNQQRSAEVKLAITF